MTKKEIFEELWKMVNIIKERKNKKIKESGIYSDNWLNGHTNGELLVYELWEKAIMNLLCQIESKENKEDKQDE